MSRVRTVSLDRTRSCPPRPARPSTPLLAEADPLAEVLVDVACPDCGAEFGRDSTSASSSGPRSTLAARRLLREIDIAGPRLRLDRARGARAHRRAPGGLPRTGAGDGARRDRLPRPAGRRKSAAPVGGVSGMRRPDRACPNASPLRQTRHPGPGTPGEIGTPGRPRRRGQPVGACRRASLPAGQQARRRTVATGQRAAASRSRDGRFAPLLDPAGDDRRRWPRRRSSAERRRRLAHAGFETLASPLRTRTDPARTAVVPGSRPPVPSPTRCNARVASLPDRRPGRSSSRSRRRSVPDVVHVDIGRIDVASAAARGDRRLRRTSAARSPTRRRSPRPTTSRQAVVDEQPARHRRGQRGAAQPARQRHGRRRSGGRLGQGHRGGARHDQARRPRAPDRSSTCSCTGSAPTRAGATWACRRTTRNGARQTNPPLATRPALPAHRLRPRPTSRPRSCSATRCRSCTSGRCSTGTRSGRALDPSPLGPSILPPAFQALAAADLADQVEAVTVTLEPMDTEEMSRLWSAIQAHYRPTAAYVVSVVLIEAQQARSGAAARPDPRRLRANRISCRHCRRSRPRHPTSHSPPRA